MKLKINTKPNYISESQKQHLTAFGFKYSTTKTVYGNKFHPIPKIIDISENPLFMLEHVLSSSSLTEFTKATDNSYDYAVTLNLQFN